LKSKTYIIAWDEAIQNCINISKQLEGSDVEHVFYNVSSYEEQNSNWVRRPDIRYNSHFFTAIKDFMASDFDVFIFNTGDIAHSDYIGYTKYIEKIFEENPELGAFAPNNTNDNFVGEYSFIGKSKKYQNLYLSTNTNGAYLALNRDIVEYLSKFYDWCLETKEVDFTTMRSGWGLDMSYCALIIYLNRVIYRDSGINMYHPKDQSYGQDIALKEYIEVINAFRKFCDSINVDSNRIAFIIDLTVRKVRNLGTVLNIRNMYSEPEKVMQA
jgi:hypothetical protein